jgi:predicted ribosome quality control (RQC) complex YloA/Tae2 family protein
MEIEIFLEKSVEENAGVYFDLAKKNKKKLEGAKKAVKVSEEKLAVLLKNEEKFMQKEKAKQEKLEKKKAKKKEWFHKFHWFKSSEGFLCVGGKDATSNEIIIKKHTEKEDIVFHTDLAGSPFFVVKNGDEAGEATLNETAQAVAAYSKAWKLGHGTVEVFYVKPEQVTKKAQQGEFLAKGSFMVHGKTTYLRPNLEYSLGLLGDEIIGGPQASIEAQTPYFVVVVPGRNKKSAMAKKIKKDLGDGDLDDLIAFLPAGGCDLKKIPGRKRKKK